MTGPGGFELGRHGQLGGVNAGKVVDQSHRDDGQDHTEVADVAADLGREEAGAPEVLEVDGQQEGQNEEEDGHEEDV